MTALDDLDDIFGSAETETEQFLRELYGHADGGFVTISRPVLGRSRGGMRTEWFPASDLAALASSLEREPDNAYIGVALRREQLGGSARGEEKDCSAMVAFVADIDVAGPGHKASNLPPTFEAAFELLDAFPLAPTVVVHTGGGLQAWWAFAEPIDVTEAREVAGRWGATWPEFGRRRNVKIDNVGDIARILRPPGTVRRKPGCDPKSVTIVRADWRRRYTLDDLDEVTLEPPPPERPPKSSKPPQGDSLIEWFISTHPIGDELEALGCVYSHTSRADGRAHYFAPAHAQDRAQTGVTVYDERDAVIWSESFAQQLGVSPRASLDAFSLYRIRVHEGDQSSALRAARTMRDGSTAPAPAVDPSTGEIVSDAEQPVDDVDYRHLPDEFWQARPVLQHVRQAALSRMLSPDALMAAVLARTAAIVDPSVKIPPLVSASTLSIYAALIGGPGTGKSSTVAASRELMPCDLDTFLDDLPLGSGEGMIEAYYGSVEVEGDDKKKRTERRQVKRGAQFFLDEGEALADLGARKGSTILPTLRTMWRGETAGAMNASAERRRILPAGAYSIGLVIAFQPGKAADLLADDGGGTPQRFEWAMSTSPSITRTPPPWPGPLDWERPSVVVLGGKRPDRYLELDEAIVSEVLDGRFEVNTGARVESPMEAHATLAKLKVAALLAILDGRLHVNADDWRLAELYRRTSRAVRAWVLEHVRIEQRQREEAATARVVRRDAAVESSGIARATERVARTIAKRIHKTGPVAIGRAPSMVASRDRQLVAVADAIDHAIGAGWISREGDTLGPGKAVPL